MNRRAAIREALALEEIAEKEMPLIPISVRADTNAEVRQLSLELNRHFKAGPLKLVESDVRELTLAEATDLLYSLTVPEISQFQHFYDKEMDQHYFFHKDVVDYALFTSRSDEELVDCAYNDLNIHTDVRFGGKAVIFRLLDHSKSDIEKRAHLFVESYKDEPYVSSDRPFGVREPQIVYTSKTKDPIKVDEFMRHTIARRKIV